MRRLSFVIERKNNSFTFIKLLAALSVVYAHAFVLFPTNGHTDIISKSRFINSSVIGINVFFFLSGLFVTASFDKFKNPVSFTMVRVLRLIPALFVCISFTVFIVGPIVTQISLKDYFESSVTWIYFAFNATIFKIVHTLPGVFHTNYYPDDVNGSLWSLALEVKCYLMVLVLGVLSVFKKKRYTVLAFALIFTLYFLHNSWLNTNLLLAQFILFIAGCLAYTFRDQIIIDIKIALGLIAVTVIAVIWSRHWFIVPFWITLIYLMVWFGSLPLLKKIKLPGDYSYGIYIYSFLIQQLCAYYFPAIATYPSFLIVMPVTLLLSILSWHFIEKPAIDFGHRLFSERQAKNMPPPAQVSAIK